MSIEDKLKEYILTKYKSVREFASVAEIPYTTMDGILKRGVGNAGVGNIIKICETLGISADELAHGRITASIAKHERICVELTDLVRLAKRDILEFDEVTLDGETMSMKEIDMFMDMMEMGMELIKRNRTR